MTATFSTKSFPNPLHRPFFFAGPMPPRPDEAFGRAPSRRPDGRAPTSDPVPGALRDAWAAQSGCEPLPELPLSIGLWSGPLLVIGDQAAAPMVVAVGDSWATSHPPAG